MATNRRGLRGMLTLAMFGAAALPLACDRAAAPAKRPDPNLVLLRTFPERAGLEPNAAIACVADTAVHLTAELRRDDAPVERLSAAAWTLPPGDAVAWFNRAATILHVREAGRHIVRVEHGARRAQVSIVAQPRPALPPSGHDIEVLTIARHPRAGAAPAGWPRVGDEVVWCADVAVWSRRKLPLSYEWRLDGNPVAAEQLRVEACAATGGAERAHFVAPWDGRRRVLSIHVQSETPVRERILKNNALSIATDAEPIGLWVERSVWDWHRRHQPQLPLGDASSFTGWAQRQVNYFNDRVAAVSEDPNAPPLRIDRVVVVPDDALGLTGSTPRQMACGGFSLTWCWGFPTGAALDEQRWSPSAARDAMLTGAVGDAPMHLDLPLLRDWGRAYAARLSISNPFPPDEAKP